MKRKIDNTKVIVAGIIGALVIWLVNMGVGTMTGGLYELTPYLWKAMDGAWTVKVILLNVFTGILLSWFYPMFVAGSYTEEITAAKGKKKKKIMEPVWIEKGFFFGLVIWALANMIGIMMTWITMAVPTAVIAAWLFGGLLSYMMAGIAIAFVYDKM